jgi:hypothetical protein
MLKQACQPGDIQISQTHGQASRSRYLDCCLNRCHSIPVRTQTQNMHTNAWTGFTLTLSWFIQPKNQKVEGGAVVNFNHNHPWQINTPWPWPRPWPWPWACQSSEACEKKSLTGMIWPWWWLTNKAPPLSTELNRLPAAGQIIWTSW